MAGWNCIFVFKNGKWDCNKQRRMISAELDEMEGRDLTNVAVSFEGPVIPRYTFHLTLPARMMSESAVRIN